MGASVHCSGESSATITGHFLLALLRGSGSVSSVLCWTLLPAPHVLPGHWSYSVVADLWMEQEISSWYQESPASSLRHHGRIQALTAAVSQRGSHGYLSCHLGCCEVCWPPSAALHLVTQILHLHRAPARKEPISCCPNLSKRPQTPLQPQTCKVASSAGSSIWAWMVEARGSRRTCNNLHSYKKNLLLFRHWVTFFSS